MVDVVTLSNPEAMLREDVQDLFRRAFPEGGLVAPDGFDSVAEDFVKLVLDNNSEVLVAADKTGLKGLAIILYPDSPIIPTPQVFHLYCQGSFRAKDTLVQAVVDKVREKGYTRMWAINGTGKPDAVWARAFRKAGQPKPVGSVMEFDL